MSRDKNKKSRQRAASLGAAGVVDLVADAERAETQKRLKAQERGMRDKQDIAKLGRAAFESNRYGTHGPDAPEGQLWRELLALALQAPAAEEGLEKLRERIRGGETLDDRAYDEVPVARPLGDLTHITKEGKQSDDGVRDNYHIGRCAIASLATDTPEERADFAHRVRGYMDDKGGMTLDAAQWVIEQWTTACIYFNFSKQTDARIGVNANILIYEQLRREAVKNAIG